MTLFAFLGAIESGLIYSIVALAVFISFRILNFPDLTVDGSFPLGAAVAVILIIAGYNPYLASFAAFLSGCLAGMVTAFLNVRFKILHLLASILVMTALYSINLRIMGRPNLSLLFTNTIFTPIEILGLPKIYCKIICLSVIVVAVKLFLDFFLKSQVGLAMRAAGMNPHMARAQGVSTNQMVYMGIALSNGLVAFAGALFAQVNAFTDISIGIGTIIYGLAAVILGQTILSRKIIFIGTLACILGSILYRLAIAMALNTDMLGLKTSDLSLITSLLVVIALILPASKRKLQALSKNAK